MADCARTLLNKQSTDNPEFPYFQRKESEQLLEEACFINESAYVELIEYVGFLLYLMVTHFYFQSLCVVIFRPDC